MTGPRVECRGPAVSIKLVDVRVKTALHQTRKPPVSLRKDRLAL
jgi:hypothetical protein